MGSIIRYPGSKQKLARKILDLFPPDLLWNALYQSQCLYCEPFVGSGAMLRGIISHLKASDSVVINDLDPGIAYMWKAIRDDPAGLRDRVKVFKPEAEAFYACKKQDGDLSLDPVTIGFQKIVLHRTSFSGLGYMAGGPLGGKDQESAYTPDCRWNSEVIQDEIENFNLEMRRLRRFDIHNTDFEAVLSPLPDYAFAYLDPPYYLKGVELYRYPMDEADHLRLADLLKRARFRWVLSYDDHPAVRGLYQSWAKIQPLAWQSNIPTAKGPRRKNQELAISNF